MYTYTLHTQTHIYSTHTQIHIHSTHTDTHTHYTHKYTYTAHTHRYTLHTEWESSGETIRHIPKPAGVRAGWMKSADV